MENILPDKVNFTLFFAEKKQYLGHTENAFSFNTSPVIWELTTADSHMRTECYFISEIGLSLNLQDAISIRPYLINDNNNLENVPEVVLLQTQISSSTGKMLALQWIQEENKFTWRDIDLDENENPVFSSDQTAFVFKTTSLNTDCLTTSCPVGHRLSTKCSFWTSWLAILIYVLCGVVILASLLTWGL